jgi:hypothetical protein
VARIRFGQETTVGTVQQTITSRIRAGKVVPIISKVIGNDLVLGTGQYKQMLKAYAEHVRYDLTGDLRLSQVAQYVSVVREHVPDRQAAKEQYLEFAKSWLCHLAEAKGAFDDILAEVDEQFDSLSFSQLAHRLGYPEFDRGQADPLLVLSSFPLSIYITTTPHYFVEMALKRANKAPCTMICPWRDGLESRPFYLEWNGELILEDNYQPHPNKPLVYHLHGFDLFPASLVLTEDDHLEFLVAISRDKGRNTDLVPRQIREALVQSSLLLLGYDLRSWDFRILFWGLIKPDFKRDYKSVSVQLDPAEVDEKYLQSYLSEADFNVYPGDIYQYVEELRRGMEG